jgi:hypothetical protein
VIVNQTQEAIRLLTSERTAIDAALAALNGGGGGGAGTGPGTVRQPAAISLPATSVPPGAQQPLTGKRKVTAAARRHMAAAQKTRWAKAHPNKGVTNNAPVPVAAAPVAATPAKRKTTARSHKKKAAIARKAAAAPPAEKAMTA